MGTAGGFPCVKQAQQAQRSRSRRPHHRRQVGCRTAARCARQRPTPQRCRKAAFGCGTAEKLRGACPRISCRRLPRRSSRSKLFPRCWSGGESLNRGVGKSLNRRNGLANSFNPQTLATNLPADYVKTAAERRRQSSTAVVPESAGNWGVPRAQGMSDPMMELSKLRFRLGDAPEGRIRNRSYEEARGFDSTSYVPTIQRFNPFSRFNSRLRPGLPLDSRPAFREDGRRP